VGLLSSRRCTSPTLVSFDGGCRSSDFRDEGLTADLYERVRTAAMTQNSVRHNLINCHVPIHCTLVVRNIVVVGCAYTLVYARCGETRSFAGAATEHVIRMHLAASRVPAGIGLQSR
jgi:hypothetical protein